MAPSTPEHPKASRRRQMRDSINYQQPLLGSGGSPGYDHQAEVATHDTKNVTGDPQNSLTNKEDSIWREWGLSTNGAPKC